MWRAQFILVLVCGGLLAGGARGQGPGLTALSAQSHSGQFLVYGGRAGECSPQMADLATNAHFIQLEPMLLPASCERIKQSLWRELEVSRAWQGRICLALHPAASAEEAVTLISQPFNGGWRYRVELPEVVQRVRYVRALVQVLLLELANRNGRERSAEIPTWLSEGLTRHLLVAEGNQIFLQPPRTVRGGVTLSSTLVDARRVNPLGPAHQELMARSPLTFEELSWPAPEQLAGEAGELYASSAQLFVSELMRLKDGRACLRAMVEDLPQYYNWQFAFLHAFRGAFQRPLEVEKWWALQVVRFTGRDLAQSWPVAEGWQRLDQTIRSAVQVRTGANELPLHADVPLQTLLRLRDHRSQAQALKGKLRELELLQPRLAREQSALVEDYRQVLENYLQNRDRKGMVPFRRGAVQRQALEEALQQLDALDARRKAMRPAEGVVAAKVEGRRAN